MPKIIAVCGNPGSGKSLLSCMLSERLSTDDEVLLINYSADVPMHPIWQPLQKVDKVKSLGNILSSPSINIATLSESIEVHQKNNNVGLLGYVSGNTPMDFVDNTYQKSIELIKTAMNITDGYIIIDCCSDFADVFRPAAIEMADTAFMVLSPDLRGLHYYNSQREMLQNSPAFRFDEINVIASKDKRYCPTADMNKLIKNGFLCGLDFSEDLEKSTLQGNMFNCSKAMPLSCKKSLSAMLAVISNE